MATVAIVKCDTPTCTTEVTLKAACLSSAEIEFYELEESGWIIDRDGVDSCPSCASQREHQLDE